MPEVRVHLYEGLFLLNQQSVASDFAGCVQHVQDILNRAEAETVLLTKWDERKLAYEIKGQKRGAFLLAYFRARTTQLANIDRDCTLSEIVLRSLLTRADHVGEAELEVARKGGDLATEVRLRSPKTEAAPAPAAPAPAPEGEPAAAAPAEAGQA